MEFYTLVDQQIRLEILKRLKQDYRFKTDSGSWLRGGKCPACDHKELYINADAPWVLRCGRSNKCGEEWSTKSLYDDLFNNWSERYKQTPEEPDAAAKAYLRDGRGLNVVKLAGCYTQELYRDWETQATSGTVRFTMPCNYGPDAPEATRGTAGYWERIIDQPKRFGKKKANMPKGWRFAGHVWFHPSHTIELLADAGEIWFSEGIFDTAALNEAFDLCWPFARSVSTLSTNNYPAKFLAALDDACERKAIASGKPKTRPTLVFAYDPGNAGVTFTRKWVKQAREEGWTVRAAQIWPDGEGTDHDWNDLHQAGKLTAADLETYLANGDITIAKTASEKAFLLYKRNNRLSSFNLTFESRTYWASFSPERINAKVDEWAESGENQELQRDEIYDKAAEETGTVEEIANCAFRTLYFQQDNALKDNSYYIRIDFPGKQKTVKGNFSGSAVTAGAEFKKRMASLAGGALWVGSPYQLDRIMKGQLANIRTVDCLYFKGYSISHKAWMFDTLAVTSGRIIERNDEDYFQIGKEGLKLPSSGEGEASTDHFSLSPLIPDNPFFWWDDFYAAFADLGIVTLSYWFMSLFAEQIRSEWQDLGYFELTGEGGSGKSTILIFLWKLVGRLGNYEGFDPNKSTAAGLSRELVKYGNLPVCFIEGDRKEDSHAKRFDWDELKPLYNGNPPRTRGVASGGTETFAPRFRGSVVIAQNHAIENADVPVLERIMHITMDKSRFSPTGKKAGEQIKKLDVKDVSPWIIAMIKQEKKIIAHFNDRFVEHDRRLFSLPDVVNDRLARTHGQLAAALDCMTNAMNAYGKTVITEAQREAGHALITKMCRERHIAVKADHPKVADFWDLFDYIETQATDEHHYVNLSRDSVRNERISISLPHLEQRAATLRLQLPATMLELKRLLPDSKSRKYISNGTVNCRDGKARHCWNFVSNKEAIIV